MLQLSRLVHRSSSVAITLSSRVVCNSTCGVRRDVSSTPQRMSGSEAFVETMVARKVSNVFGIVGSAFMDALDLFPSAGIRFISVQHEQNAAHMADGYARASLDGRTHGVCIAQNGPGITNFVTAIAAAYWAHSPVVAITPEAGTATKGLGGFQELDQVPMFAPITKYQGHVNNAARMAEITARSFDIAINERGPVQLNIPRDYFYGEANYAIPQPNYVEHSAGGPQSLQAAAALLASAKNPVILAGGGVVTSSTGPKAAIELAEYLTAPVAVTYLHNDAFPKSHKLWMGPLGYQGSKAAMNALAQADVVLALGTRLGPFGTLPQYGFEYWPKSAKLIQVDLNARNLGLTRPADVTIQGDSGLAASSLLSQLRNLNVASKASSNDRLSKIHQFQKEWSEQLDAMTFGAPRGTDTLCKPREALRALERALPQDAIVATDIGNMCSVSNSYLRFEQPRSFLAAMTFGNCGYSFPAAMGAKVARPDKPVFAYVGDGAWGMSLNEVLTCVRENIAVTAVVFNNQQWGAEKKNQVLWFGDRYIGSNLTNPSFAEVAKAMGAEGIRCTNVSQIGDAVSAAAANQRAGKATVLEIMCTRELGDPFRRDAMRLPQRLLDKYKHTSLSSESPTGQPIDIQKQ